MLQEQTNDSGYSGENRVCPWQHVRTFDNLLRPLIHNPRKLFGLYVRPGMTVLDAGCGAGFASLGLARLVGNGGVVIAADLQPEMLRMVTQRAAKAGLGHRIRTHRCQADRIGVQDRLDFAVAFWMVHEVPDRRAFLQEVLDLLKPGGHLFIAEPKLHTSDPEFEQTIREAQELGFRVSKRPGVRFSRAVLLQKELGQSA